MPDCAHQKALLLSDDAEERAKFALFSINWRERQCPYSYTYMQHSQLLISFNTETAIGMAETPLPHLARVWGYLGLYVRVLGKDAHPFNSTLLSFHTYLVT